MAKLAVIGGTGLGEIPGFECDATFELDTPFGRPSAELLVGQLNGHPLAFLPRHGAGHTIAPHKINYRANIRALKDHGIEAVIGVAAVGGISPDVPPGSLVVPDQIVDYTYGRAHTFFEDEDAPVVHVDFTYPYDEPLRQRLLAAAAKAEVPITAAGVYGATQGPRLESAAEINRMDRDGCTIVGMTGMPEAALAREAELAYAHLAVIVNEAAGRGAPGEIITMDIIRGHMERGMGQVVDVLRAVATDLD